MSSSQPQDGGPHPSKVNTLHFRSSATKELAAMHMSGMVQGPEGELLRRIAATNQVTLMKGFGGLTTLAQAHGGKPKLLCYNLEKLVRMGGILTLFTRGTVCTLDYGMLIMISVQTVMCLVIALGLVLYEGGDMQAIAEFETRGLKDLAVYMNSFVPFVLGLYISVCMGRWWALRVKALGSVFDAIANVTMMVATSLPQPEHAAIRTNVVRWSMASIALIVKAAREVSDISNLRESGALELTEVEAISPQAPYARAIMMWVWIMQMCQEAYHLAEGPGPHSPKLMLVYTHCLQAKEGIETIETYLRTQMPFAYVHLIAMLVQTNNVLIGVRCSVVCTVAYASKAYQAMLYELMMLFLVPVLYHGLLTISYVIHDPFGDDMLDFPIAAFTEYVAQACDAALLAQTTFWHATSNSGLHLPLLPPVPPPPPRPAQDPVQDHLMEAVLARLSQHMDSIPRIMQGLESLKVAVADAERRRAREADGVVQALLRPSVLLQAHSRQSAGCRPFASSPFESLCGRPIPQQLPPTPQT